jgi:hypothetical protein
MNIKKLFVNKKVVAIGATAVLTVGIAGAAFAYFTTTGAGGGSTTAGTSSAVTLHAAINTGIIPGDGGQSVTFTADNPSSASQEVTTISFGSVTSTDAGCQAMLTANTGQFSMADVTSDTVVPGSSTGFALTGKGTLVWGDSATVDQTACAGKPLTLNVTSN